MIEELGESALEELKRADHLIYVSLKYTRTVDIIKNTIQRLLSAFDIAIIQGLEYTKESKRIPSIPTSALQRVNLLSRFLPQTKKSLEFYQVLKSIDRAEYSRKEEYRKNVALIIKKRSKKIEVDIETLKYFFDSTVCFVRGMAQITMQKTFPAAQRTTFVLPVKKKKEIKKPTTVKKKPKPVKKSYKLNPNKKQKYTFY
jgi:hypothetical protein